MTHNAAHVILKLSTPLDSDKPNGLKAWHCLLAALLIGFALGALLL